MSECEIVFYVVGILLGVLIGWMAHWWWSWRPQQSRRIHDDPVDILRAIIYASDGCHGHHGCNHSMEPWQRARRLIMAIDGEE